MTDTGPLPDGGSLCVSGIEADLTVLEVRGEIDTVTAEPLADATGTPLARRDGRPGPG